MSIGDCTKWSRESMSLECGECQRHLNYMMVKLLAWFHFYGEQRDRAFVSCWRLRPMPAVQESKVWRMHVPLRGIHCTYFLFIIFMGTIAFRKLSTQKQHMPYKCAKYRTITFPLLVGPTFYTTIAFNSYVTFP